MGVRQRRYTDLFVVSESKYSFEDTVAILTDTILSKGWQLPVVHDYQEILRKSGKKTLPVKVFEVCKKRYLDKILSAEQLKSASSLLPCRISVYATVDNKVFLSHANSKGAIERTDGWLQEVMARTFAELEDVVSSVA